MAEERAPTRTVGGLAGAGGRGPCIRGLVGKRAWLSMHPILVRIPKHAAEQRRELLRADANDPGWQPSAKSLDPAAWTILLTNVLGRLLSLPMVCLPWHIERQFRLWKAHGKGEEWRSKNPFRVLTARYVTICAMLMHQWFFCIMDAGTIRIAVCSKLLRSCVRRSLASWWPCLTEKSNRR